MIEDRKHLTSLEVGKLIEATASSRNAERDRCLMLLTFRHGLRVFKSSDLYLLDEETRLKWDAPHRADGATYGEMTRETA